MPEFAASSETPPLDTERILRALDAEGVRYILIGGTACIVHGAEQTTYDTDVLPALDKENLEALLTALASLGAAVLVDADRMRFEDGEPWEVLSLRHGHLGLADAEAWHFTTTAGLVDVVMSAAGVGDYDAHAARATEVEVFGMSVTVAGIDDIIQSKESLGREKDLSVLDQLRRIRDAEQS